MPYFPTKADRKDYLLLASATFLVFLSHFRGARTSVQLPKENTSITKDSKDIIVEALMAINSVFQTILISALIP